MLRRQRLTTAGRTVGVVVSLAAAAPGTVPSHSAGRAPETALRFGAAVAIAGDELLIGRPDVAARPSAPGGGVHVFRRRGAGRWIETTILVPKRAPLDEDFGAALVVDGSLLAVGAPLAEGGRGAVYLFERLPSGRWTERAKLVAAASVAGDQFGRVVALRGGVLLAGAPTHMQERGAVAVFRRAVAGTWSEQTRLRSADTTVKGFGRALAFGRGWVAVGAPGAPPMGLGFAGRTPPSTPQVLIFRDSASTWIPDAQLTSPETPLSRGARFGTALMGEHTELWVSDPMASGGIVFGFRRDSAGRWNAVGQLAAKTEGGRGRFGAALARAGHELLISAADGSIAVFRYDSAAARWAEVQQISYRAPGDSSGSALPFIARKPGWITDAPALAANDGLALAGFVWIDTFEGAAFALERDGARGSWRPSGTIIDTAWTTRRPLTGVATPCHAGKVKGVFGCRNTELLAFLPRQAIGSGEDDELSSLWGWTDTATNREFVLVARTRGTSFVEVTDPRHPRYLGDLPWHAGAQPSHWRDVKVYSAHAFIVSETGGQHGMQVFDLTQLRNVTNAPATFQETAHYNAIASAHTLALNEATGFAYAVGTNGAGETCGGGLHMINIQNPVRPVFAGCYSETLGGKRTSGYIHETQCVVYHGPDAQYRGKEICFNAAETAVGIADVTDKKQPKSISVATYPKVGYTHQGWLTEDQRYFFVGDEFDEGDEQLKTPDAEVRTRTMVFDMSDLDDPVLAAEFSAATGATDHNLYIRGHYMYQSNYTAGLRVIDVRNPPHPKEVGFFDTAPAFSDSPGPGQPRMLGTWSNYPYIKSGTIAVASTHEGLFLLRFRTGPGR